MSALDRKARRAKFTLIGLGALVGAVLVGGGVSAFLLLGGEETASSTSGKPSASASPSPTQSSTGSSKRYTPATGQKATLVGPTGHKNGVSIGFPHTANGAISAVVSFWEEYAWLDDTQARQQLAVVTSPDAVGYIDEQISEVRKLREGAGLPPSGPAPAQITFTTDVHAVRATSLDDTGDVVQVWMSYDRYGTPADGGPDKDPLKGEADDLIVRWQDGQWKLTNEPKYWSKRSFPVAYDPDSSYAWQDGWSQVRRAD
ncbi:hypothetical protein ABT001_30605 [Streptomyces sp. NPDC002793]|uniref:hypothetical protein n=1 Tax=Streptomyces sp. NPDC002793 TaxID=3154432 RepID=UPI00331C3B67